MKKLVTGLDLSNTEANDELEKLLKLDRMSELETYSHGIIPKLLVQIVGALECLQFLNDRGRIKKVNVLVEEKAFAKAVKYIELIEDFPGVASHFTTDNVLVIGVDRPKDVAFYTTGNVRPVSLSSNEFFKLELDCDEDRTTGILIYTYWEKSARDQLIKEKMDEINSNDF